MNRNSRLCFAGLLLCAVVFSPAGGTAFAQDYPKKPIRLIAPTAPGGSTDVAARPVAEKLREILGQPVLIEYRPGADNRLGTEMVARATPDGYTLLVVANGPHTIAPNMFIKLPYDPDKSFEPITKGTLSSNFLLVNPSLPVKSVGELVALAKSKPGKLNYATSGVGTMPWLDSMVFLKMAGLDILHVPYKGSSESMTALLGGHVDMAFASVASTVSQVKAGTLRALATNSAKRSPLAPDVPTMVESGFPDFVSYNCNGFFAPGGTPKQIVNKLNTAIVKVLKMPDVIEFMRSQGSESSPSTPEEFAEFVKSERAKWGKVIKDAGIQPQ